MISFISEEPYYTAEKLGYKNNTVREVDLSDNRFKKLVVMEQTGKYEKIEIHNGGFVEADAFKRQINHIAFWKNLVIITWEHEFIR